jgi:hypothetical protein
MQRLGNTSVQPTSFNTHETINLRYAVNKIKEVKRTKWPITVAAGSKVWVFGRSPAGIVGSNPAGGMDVCLL